MIGILSVVKIRNIVESMQTLQYIIEDDWSGRVLKEYESNIEYNTLYSEIMNGYKEFYGEINVEVLPKRGIRHTREAICCLSRLSRRLEMGYTDEYANKIWSEGMYVGISMKDVNYIVRSWLLRLVSKYGCIRQKRKYLGG